MTCKKGGVGCFFRLGMLLWIHIEIRTIGAGVCRYRQWVKGKQVEDLRDLVTVSREHWMTRIPNGMLPTGFWRLGRDFSVRGWTSQETCRLLVQENSRSRGLGRTVILQILIPDHKKQSFLLLFAGRDGSAMNA